MKTILHNLQTGNRNKISGKKDDLPNLLRLALFILCFLPAYIGLGQTTLTFSGSGTFNVPAGVTSITVECWGAGGAGGTRTTNGVAGGGGGGAYSSQSFAVTPGNSFNYSAGTGGTTNPAVTGGDTWFSSTTILLAKGGNSVSNNIATGALGGLAAAGFGTTKYNGGNGANGNTSGTDYSGGGGSSAGTVANGTNAINQNGAIAPAGGGNGGLGRHNSVGQGNGSAGVIPGGGGGGGYRTSTGTRTGGAGADGYIKITYTQLTYKSQLVGMSYGASNWCTGEARNVTVQIKNIGTATWTDGSPDINIGVKWNTNGTSWTDYHVRVNAGNLAPGVTGTYTLPILATNNVSGTYTTPLAAGNNNLIFDVVYEGLSWFGDNGGGVGPGNTKFTSPNITIITIPTAVSAFAAPNPVCEGTLLMLTGNASGATSWAWTGPNSFLSAVQSPTIPNVSMAGGGTYTLTATNSCGSATPVNTTSVTITPKPVVSAGSAVCVGSTMPLSPSTGGTWASSNNSIATVNASTGVVTGVTAGSVTFTYTQTSTGCSNITSLVTVNTRPTAAINSLPASICNNGGSTNITGIVTATGNWTLTLSNGAIATGTGNGSFTIPVNPTSTTNYTIASLVDANCSSIGADLTGSTLVTVNEPVVITTQPSTQTVCSSFPVSFTVAATGTGLTYQWYYGATPLADNANTSGSNSTTLNITQAGLGDAGTYHVVISGLAPCPPVISANAILNVNQDIEIIDQPAIQVKCAGETVTFSVNAIGTGLTYQWRKGAMPLANGGNIAGATSAILTITNVNAGDAAPDYNVVISGSGGICPQTISANAALIVNPIPNAIATPATQTVCSGINIAAISFSGAVPSTTFNWTRDNPGVTGTIALSGSGTITGNLVNNTNVPITVTFTITPTASGCFGPAVTATVLVNPTPDAVPVPSSQSICSGGTITTISSTSIVSGATYTWTRNNPAVTGTIGNSGSGSIAGTLINNTSNPITVTFTITPTANGCSGIPATATVLVYPSPVAIATPSTQSICNNAGITPIILSSATAGTTYTWTRDNPAITGSILNSGSGNISGTLINSSNVPVTVTFTITPIANGCGGLPVTATVLVNPGPDATALPSAQTKCSGIAITPIVLSGNVTGTIFNWTRNNTGTVTGMPNSGSGNISGTLNNTTNAAITVTFTITPVINGCPGTQITATVLVEPSPSVVVTPATQNVCNNIAVVNMAITNPNNVLGTGFTWTRTNTGFLTGIAGSGSGNTISGTLTNSTAVTQTSLFNIIATAGNGCIGTATGTVNVYATETAPAISAAQTVCILSTPDILTGIPGTGGSGVFAYQWQSSLDNSTWTNIAGATGINYQPPAIGFAGPTTFYRLRAIGACGTLYSNTIYIEVVSNVNFTFDLDNGLTSTTVCPSTNFTPTISGVHLSSSAVRFTWSANPAYINLPTGGPVGSTSGAFLFFRTSSGSIGPLTTMNSTNAPVTTTITITPNVYDYPGPPSGAFQCSTTPQNITITINPTPTVNAIASQTVCNNSSTAAVSFSGFVPGTVYNWTNNTPSIGLAASGAGNIPSFTATNAGIAPVTATITVTPSYTNGGKTCTGASKTFTITVNPAPTVNVISNQAVCNNASTTAVNFSGAVAGTVFNWTNNTASIGLAASGSGNIASFTAVNGGTTPVIATITVTPSYTNGATTCTGTPRTFTITVNPNVSAGTISGTSPLCINATATYNSNGNAGGTWSSSNTAVATVNASTGLVTAVGAGTTNIIFTISIGCASPATAFKTLTVSPNANSGIVSGASPLCINATTTYTSNGDAGGTWSSSNTAVATVNASTGLVTAISAGTANIIYSVTGCNPVPSFKTITVSPNANAGVVSGASPLCTGATTTYSSNGDAGGTWSSSNTAIATVNASTGLVTAVGSGTVNIIYTLTMGCNNPVSAFKTLIVGANANAGTINGPSPLCIGAGALYFSSGNSGGTWSSSNTAVATVNASTGFVTTVGAGTTNIIYTVNTGCNSPVSNFKTLTVSPVAPGMPGSITGPSPVCANTAGFIYTIGSVTNATIYTWAVPAGWSITAGQGTTTVTVTSGSAGGSITVTAGNLCGTSGPRSLPVSITVTGTWLGVASSNWHNGANWCGGVPDETINVIIPSGTPNNPVVSSATAKANNITIANGATLTVTGVTIQVKGSVTSNNNFIAGNGTVELIGSSAQTIPAKTFYSNAVDHLVINNSVGVSLGGALDIYGSLTYGIDGVSLLTNDALTLKSTLANTAWLGNTTGKTITGNVTVERYIPNHSKAWQFLSAPISGTQTVNEAWQDTAVSVNQNRYSGYGTMLTSNLPGAVSLGFDVYTAPGPSIKVYNSLTGGYDGIANTKLLPVANPKGYMILVRGDRSVIAANQAATATTMRTKGKLFTATDAPADVTVAAGTFESIGNPYASAIDFSLVSKTGGVQTDFFYMWDPRLTTTNGAGANSAYGLGGFQTFSWNGGGYDVTPGQGSYNGSNRFIESGQAFFVRAPSNFGTVSFSEACKVSGSCNVNRVLTSPGKQLRTNLHVITGGNRVLIDGNLVQYDASYSNNIDLYDALKLNNTGENLGLARNNKKLAVERRAEILSTDTIFFNLGQPRVQQYEFEFIAANLSQSGLTAFLEDNYLHASTPVDLADTTRIIFNVINDPGSYAADRFRIVFKKVGPLPVSITNISAIRNSDKTIAVSWKVESETSMQLYTVERSTDARNFQGIITASPTANNGGRSAYATIDRNALSDDIFYRIKALSLSGQVQYSDIVKVAGIKLIPSVEIYPNPVTGRIIQMQFTNMIPGRYDIVLIYSNGSELNLSPVDIPDSHITRAVKLPALLARGIYRLKMSAPDKNVIIKTIHITE